MLKFKLFSHYFYHPLTIVMCSALQGSASENQSGPTAPSPVHLSPVQEIQQFSSDLHTYVGT